MYELLCQFRPKYVGDVVSLRTETCRSWCVSYDRNILEKFCQ